MPPSDRKEPTLSKPNAAAVSNRPGSQPKTGSSSRPPVSKTRNSSPTRVIVKKQSSLMLWLTLVLTLLIGLAVIYSYGQLARSNQSLINQQQRISDLETQLELSDDESAQSLTGLTANLRSVKKDTTLALSEIDKLWATRNVNRKAIADNKQALEDNQKSLDRSLKLLQQRASEQEILVQSLRELFSEQKNGLESLRSQLAQAVSQKDLIEITKQLKAHDEAIKSVDNFRLTVNRELLSLRAKQEQGRQSAPSQ